MTNKGKEYPFNVEGLSVGEVGITMAEAEGKVYNLKKLSDFSRNYVAATAEAGLVSGAGATALHNDKNVVIHLFPATADVKKSLESSKAIRRLSFDTKELGGWHSGHLTFLIKVFETCSKAKIEVVKDGLPEGVRRLRSASPQRFPKGKVRERRLRRKPFS